MSEALDALRAQSGIEALIFDGQDFDDLARNDRLLPLGDHLVNDEQFDPDAFWPGALDTGKRNGELLAIPLSVSPWTIAANQAVLQAAGVKIDVTNAFASDQFRDVAEVVHAYLKPLHQGFTTGYLQTVARGTADSADQFVTTPMYVFVSAAVGVLQDQQGSWAPIESDSAVNAVQLLRGFLDDRGSTLPPSDTAAFVAVSQGRVGMFGWLQVQSNSVGHDWSDFGLLPFPTMGAARTPAETVTMIGMPADVDEPTVAVAAMRALEVQLRTTVRIPALRVGAGDFRSVATGFTERDAEVLVAGLENATFITLSRRARGILNNTVDFGVLRAGVSPTEALRQAVTELEGLRAE